MACYCLRLGILDCATTGIFGVGRPGFGQALYGFRRNCILLWPRHRFLIEQDTNAGFYAARESLDSRLMAVQNWWILWSFECS